MAIINLVRHGMTDVVGKQLAGWTPGVHLNAEGWKQAEGLRRWSKSARLEAVYSSPLERTAETARAIAEPLGLPVLIRDQVGEVRYGEWTGKTLAEMEDDPEWRRWNEQRAEARCPGGESMLEIQSRFVGELLRIAESHPGKAVAVVSHGDPIRAALAHFLCMPLATVLRLQVDPASISTVVVERWGVQIAGINMPATCWCE